MSRRFVGVVLIILLLLAATAGAWFYLNGKTPANENVSSDQGTLQVKKVLDEAVISPVAAFDNNSIWYFNSSNRLFKTNVDGSNLSEFSIASSTSKLQNVLWPKTGPDFIAVYADGSKSFYDSKGKLYISLPSNIQWIEWLPDGKRVVYIWQASDKKSQQLVMANADGTGFKTIASVFWPDLALKASPDGKTVLMYRTNIQGDVNKIYAVNLDTGVVSTIVDSGKNTAAMWLPTGNKFLYAQGSKIYLYDVLNHQATDLNLNTTLDKVAVDSGVKNLYAAVGNNFIKVNLATAKTENYFQASSDVQPKNLMVIGNTVYFTDAKDSKLYMISK